MIIIIIILAKGINHSHVRVRTRQGAGRGPGLIADIRLLARKTPPRPINPPTSVSTSICPLSAQHLLAVVNPARSRCVKTNQLNAHRSMTVLHLNYVPIKLAEYESTAANLTGNRLSGRKHCLSGHPSLNCNEWL